MAKRKSRIMSARAHMETAMHLIRTSQGTIRAALNHIEQAIPMTYRVPPVQRGQNVSASVTPELVERVKFYRETYYAVHGEFPTHSKTAELFDVNQGRISEIATGHYD